MRGRHCWKCPVGNGRCGSGARERHRVKDSCHAWSRRQDRNSPVSPDKRPHTEPLDFDKQRVARGRETCNGDKNGKDEIRDNRKKYVPKMREGY